MKKILLAVEGMTCDHCVHHVTEALQEVSGVQSVQVSLDHHQATLEVEDGFSGAAAATAVEEAGYIPGEVTPL